MASDGMPSAPRPPGDDATPSFHPVVVRLAPRRPSPSSVRPSFTTREEAAKLAAAEVTVIRPPPVRESNGLLFRGRDVALLLLASGLAVLVSVAGRYLAPPLTGEEAAAIARASAPGAPSLSELVEPGGLLVAHLWAFDAISGAFDRAASVLTAGRAAMLVAAAVTAALVWLLTRRVGAGPVTAVVAAVLAATLPALAGAATLVAPEVIAAPWLVASFVAALGPQREWRLIVALICIVVAAIAAPAAFVAAPLVGWAALFRDSSASRRSTSLALVGVSVAAYGGLLVLDANGQVPAGDVEVTPMLVVSVAVGVVGALVALADDRLRLIGSAGLLLAATTLVAPAAALVLAAPFLAVAFTTSAATLARSLPRLLAISFAGGLAAAGVVLLGIGLAKVDSPSASADSSVAVGDWLSKHVDSAATRVVADRLVAADLVRGGYPRANVVAAADAAALVSAATPTDIATVVVSTPLLRETTGDAAVTGQPLARLGGEGSTVDLVAVVKGATQPVGTADGSAQVAGAALSGNPQLGLDAESRRLFASGAVDPRTVTVLALLAADRRLDLTVVSDPHVAAADALRRTVVITAVDGQPLDPADPAVGRLTAWLTAQQPTYRPLVVRTISHNGSPALFVRWPAPTPPELLDPQPGGTP